MGETGSELTPELRGFLEAQHVFFVATAPLATNGHVNLSPKGLDSLRVLSPRRLAYLDLTGSGNESSAHLRENGRITIMVCAFEGRPRILRIYGRGQVVLPGDAGWPDLRARFPGLPGERQIVAVDIERFLTSCGYGVPLYEFRSERETLARWVESKGPQGLAEYRRKHNVRSLDGLPAHLEKERNPATDSEATTL